MTARLLRKWCDPEVILIVTNLFTEQSLLFHALRQARKSRAKVLLAYALRMDDAAFHPGRKLPPHNALPDISESLERIAGELRWEGLLCDTFILHGPPAEEITSLVNDHFVDRVIVAARNLKRTSHSSKASLLEHLLPVLDVPLCAIGENVPVGSYGEPPVGRISLALSLSSQQCTDCLSFASRLAQENRAHLIVLHVADGAQQTLQPEISSPMALAARIPSPVLREAGLLCPLEIAVRHGDPVQEILRYDATIPQDFIVLGSPSKLRNGRLSSTSILRNVIAEARCPVLIFKTGTGVANNFTVARHQANSASYGW